MTDKALRPEFKGSRFTIIHCEGAIDESFEKAMQRVNKSKRKSLTTALILQIERLADGHQLAASNFPQEGELPKRGGQSKAKKFYALKRKPIRAYCWLSDRKDDTYFISHYIYKDQKKLNDSDTTKVHANWKRIEEQGHER